MKTFLKSQEFFALNVDIKTNYLVKEQLENYFTDIETY